MLNKTRSNHLRLITLSGVILAVILFSSSCANRKQDQGSQIIVSVSLMPYKYFIHEIAGNDFIINVLLPPGMNHHTYEPTPRQLIDLEQSKALIINGYLPFEDVFVAHSRDNPDKIKVVETTDGLTFLLDDSCKDHGEQHEHAKDPHTWLSLVNARTESFNIMQALCEVNPAQSEKYRKNYEKLALKLDSLHQIFKEKIQNSGIPGFMIYHPALGYLAHDYGLEQLEIEKQGKNPTPYELKILIDRAKELKINTIFIQKEFDRENAEIIAHETGARIVEINPLSEEWLTNLTSILNDILNL